MLSVKGLPFSKKTALKVYAHTVGKPYEKYWTVKNGTDPLFFHPVECQHWDEAFSVYHLQTEVGKLSPSFGEVADEIDGLFCPVGSVDSFGEVLNKSLFVKRYYLVGKLRFHLDKQLIHP